MKTVGEAPRCPSDARQTNPSGCVAKSTLMPVVRQEIVYKAGNTYKTSEQQVCEVLGWAQPI
jgi:hypothetical protein